MIKSLRTTSALAAVVIMLVGACSSSSATPSPAASVPAATAPAASAPAASAPAASEPAASAPASAAPAAAVPSVPTGYAELDKALGADKPFNGKTVNDPDPVDRRRGRELRAAVADFAAATGIKIKHRQHRGEPRDRAQDPHRGRRTARPRHARPADACPGLCGRGQGDRRRHVHGCPEAQGRASGDHRPGHEGDQDLGHPVQGRRQVDHLVPDQGLRGQGLRGPHDVGRADRPVRQDRRRRLQPVVRQRRRPRRRDRLADHRLDRGSRPQDQGHSTTTTSGSATRSRSRIAGIKDALDKYVGKIFFTPNYVFGGNTRSCNTDQKTPMDPMFNRGPGEPAVLDAEDPDLVRPDFFPDQRASGQPSKYILGEDVGMFQFPTIDPAQRTPKARLTP